MNKLKSPSARDALPIFVEIGLLEKKSFVNVFFYFIIPILFFLLNLKKENYFSLEKVCVPFPTVNKTNGFTTKPNFFKNAKGTGCFFLAPPPPPPILRGCYVFEVCVTFLKETYWKRTIVSYPTFVVISM